MDGKLEMATPQSQRNYQCEKPRCWSGADRAASAWRLVSFVRLVAFGQFAGRRALLDLLAVLQVATDGAVTTRNDFLAFGQPVGNFPVRVVADPNFDGHHFHMVAFQEENDFNGFGAFLGFFVRASRVGPGV